MHTEIHILVHAKHLMYNVLYCEMNDKYSIALLFLAVTNNALHY